MLTQAGDRDTVLRCQEWEKPFGLIFVAQRFDREESMVSKRLLNVGSWWPSLLAFQMEPQEVDKLTIRFVDWKTVRAFGLVKQIIPDMV